GGMRAVVVGNVNAYSKFRFRQGRIGAVGKPGKVHRVGTASGELAPGNRNLNLIGGTFQDFGNPDRVRDTQFQIGVGIRAPDVAVNVIVSDQLVHVIAGAVGGRGIFIIVVQDKDLEANAQLLKLRST